MRELLDHIKEADVFKPASARELKRRTANMKQEYGPAVTVVYKGDRDHPDDYDNFTLNRVYPAHEDPGIEGFLILRNDLGVEVTMSSVDFDYVTQPVEEDVFKPAGEEELKHREQAGQERRTQRIKAIAAIRDSGIAEDAFGGVKFDDFTVNEPGVLSEGPAFWTQVCDHCSNGLKLDHSAMELGAGQGVCGVQGCELDADHYYDFDTKETRALNEDVFKPASKKEVDTRKSEFVKNTAARRKEDTWRDRIVDMQPEDIDPSLSIWFCDMPDEVEIRNEQVVDFVKDLKRVHQIDLSGLLTDYILKPDAERNENEFCDEAAERIAKAGLYVYNSDNYFEVFLPEDMANVPYDESVVREANVFKPASKSEFRKRQAAYKKAYTTTSPEQAVGEGDHWYEVFRNHPDGTTETVSQFDTRGEAEYAKSRLEQKNPGVEYHVDHWRLDAEGNSEPVDELQEADIFKPASEPEVTKRRKEYSDQLKAKRKGKTPYYIDLGSWIVVAKDEKEAEQIAMAKLADGERPAIDSVEPVDPDDGDYDDDYIETEAIPLKVQYPKEGPKNNEYYIDFTTWIILAGSESEAHERAEVLLGVTQDERTAPSISQIALSGPADRVNEAKPKKDVFTPASQEEVSKRREEYNKEQLRKAEEWVAIAKQELETALEVQVTIDNEEGRYVTMSAVEGKGNNGESEWAVYPSADVAESAALDRVREDLESQPEIFSSDWLMSHMEIWDTDRRMIAQEEADNQVDDGMSDDDILEEANVTDEYAELQEQIDALDTEAEDYDAQEAALEKQKEDMLEDAKETVRERKYDEIYEDLADPVQYFVHDHGMYSMEDLLKASFIHIDFDAAAQDAIDTDGVAHFLDMYDGSEVELPSGAVAFGTN